MPGTPIKKITHEDGEINAATIAVPAVLFQNQENSTDTTLENEEIDVSFHEDEQEETEDEGIEEGDEEMSGNIALKNIPLQNVQPKNPYWELPLGR